MLLLFLQAGRLSAQSASNMDDPNSVQVKPNVSRVVTDLKQVACTSICNGFLGENIYPNGDFGFGFPNIVPVDPGLAPGYIYQTNPPPVDGYYTITNSTAPWGWFAADVWINIEDNGPEPFGYMMVVNASYPPGLFFQNTVAVCENTLYEFSVDVVNIFDDQFPVSIRPNLTFMIDNVAYCETGDIPLDEQWHTVRFSFTTAPGQTSILLGMRNNAPGGYGNDIAIDNISFRACGPEILTPDTLWFCGSNQVLLQAQLFNTPFPSSVYQWQILTNGNWMDIPGANAITWNVANPQDGALYRLLVASALPNLALPNCRVVSKSIHLAHLPQLLVTASGQDVACYGQNSGSATAQALSGMAPYAYTWNNGSTGNTLTGLFAGNYLVTVTDDRGCTGGAAVTVLDAPQMAAAVVSTPVSCFGGSDAGTIASASGGSGSYTFSWNQGQSAAQIAGLTAGTYTVTITDAQGCTVSASSSITSPSILTTATTGGETACFGGNNGLAAASASGGTAPYSFQWSNGQSTSQANGLSAGPYTVTITDAQGCTASVTGSISEPSVLTTATTGGETACFGGNDGLASATASGGTGPYSFQWSNGQITAQASGLPAGPYAVTITDAQGCTASASGSITSPSILTTATMGGATACFAGNDGMASATASGGTGPYSFQWSNGQSTSQANGLSAGPYTVTITDAQGCTASASGSITEPSILTTATTGGATACFAGNDGLASATASGGTGPYSFQWSNGQSTAQANGLSAGLYTVTITDAQGCTASVTGSITAPIVLTPATTGGATACFAGNDGMASATASGGTGPYSFQWSNGQSTAQANGLSAGLYTVTITDAQGCTASASSSITSPAVLTPATTGGATACFAGNDGMASATASGGTGPYSFQWSNGQSTAQANGLSAGSYTITVTDALGCTAITTGIIQEPSLLMVNAAASMVSCFGGNDATLSANVSGGTNPYNYLWSNGQSSTYISGLAAGTYSLTATDAQGCTTSANATVNTPPAIQSSVSSQDASCFGGADGKAVITSIGGTAPYSYLWQNGQTGESASSLAAGNYQVTATDALGCTYTGIVSVGQPSEMSHTVQAQDAACHGDATGMAWVNSSGGTPPYTYLWQNGETSAQINGLPAGWYALSISDAQQCMSVAQVWVGQSAPLQVDPQALPVSCPEVSDGEASATAAGGVGPYVFAWSNGQSGPAIAALSMGAYTVTATDAFGCTALGTETVASAPALELDLGLDQTLFLGDELLLTANTNLPSYQILDYSWSGTGGAIQCADCFQYQFLPVESGCERVLVRTVNGCEATDEVCYKLLPRRRIYVPNVFHPDDSGENDYFTIYSDASVKQIRYLKIYSRWGEQLFQAENIQTNHEPSGWDGSFRGQPMNPSVFVWMAELEFIDGELLFLKGDVTLVR